MGAFFLLAGFDLLAKKNASQIFRNYNFAFSLPVPLPAMYLIYFVAILAMILYFIKNGKKFNRPETAFWLLVFTGAILNVGERLALGYVRDFIYIFNGVFNLADMYILLGLLFLVFIKTNESSVEK